MGVMAQGPKPHGGRAPAKMDSRRCEELVKKEGVRVSPTTMCPALQKLKWTRKKTFHAAEQERPEVQQERRQYRQKVAEIDPEQLIFIDEMGSNVSLDHLYARGPKGHRAYAAKPLNRGQ